MTSGVCKINCVKQHRLFDTPLFLYGKKFSTSLCINWKKLADNIFGGNQLCHRILIIRKRYYNAKLWKTLREKTDWCKRSSRMPWSIFLDRNWKIIFPKKTAAGTKSRATVQLQKTLRLLMGISAYGCRGQGSPVLNRRW